MMSFLFWNINKKPIHSSVASLASDLEVDVLILVECTIPSESILIALNENGTRQYHYAPGIGNKKAEIFARFSSKFIEPVYEEDRLTIRHLKLIGKTDILLAVTHF